MVKRVLLIAPRTYLKPFDYSVGSEQAANIMEYFESRTKEKSS
jgi:hypothetical protein